MQSYKIVEQIHTLLILYINIITDMHQIEIYTFFPVEIMNVEVSESRVIPPSISLRLA